jgi:hypothetical protein
MRGRTQGVGEAHIFPMGEHLLHGFGVPFDELIQRKLALLDHLVEIFYRCHSDITSISGMLSVLYIHLARPPREARG